MATTTQIASFSEDGQYLAYSSPDGTLRIYECSTGNLKQEYSSTCHLSSTTSSLSWCRLNNSRDDPPKSKKKKLNSTGSAYDPADLKLIALGTTAGTVNLYSFSKGFLHSQLSGGHAQTVNDVCFHLSHAELFTCSDDGHVICWDLIKGQVKHKWKCDEAAVHSVCQCSLQHLVTAGHIIKLWDLGTRTVLHEFTGHSSPVFRLIPVNLGESDTCKEDSGGVYVLSAALDDRHINVWSCDTSKKEKNSLASFSVPDEPVSVSISKASASQPLMLSVITKKGIAYVFEQTLNGKKKKPIVSIAQIRGESERTVGNPNKNRKKKNKDHKGAAMPVLASLCVNGTISVALGNPMNPQFDRVAYTSMPADLVITVKEATRKDLTKKEYSQVKSTEMSNHMTTMRPEGSKPVLASTNKDRKRLRKSSVTELSVEERLKAMEDGDNSANNAGTGSHENGANEVHGRPKGVPVADTLSRLLQQGLTSGDSKIIHDVLSETRPHVMKKTIRQLPVSFTVALIKEIEKGMDSHPKSALSMCRWLHLLIEKKISYILSIPQISIAMTSMYQTLASRQRFLPKVLGLKGRLNLFNNWKKGEHSDEEVETEDEDDKTAAVIHQDATDTEDSDDSMMIDGAALESDNDNWEDLSDHDTEEENGNKDEDDEDNEDGSGESDEDDSGENEDSEAEDSDSEDEDDDDVDLL